ncbi:meiosis-specific protein MEI4 [Genypterus blacodes]|uniref:meiosis-specific protein MEI4 n=1 Tax=Genypterus blacodes TaxID=154954 RepID=UPI003F77499E
MTMSQTTETTSAKQAEWILKKVKLAIAITVIKNRPPGISGRDYAEALACNLKSQDENWKSKAQDLQQEVQELRQNLLLARVASQTTCFRDAAGVPGYSDTADDLTQDTIGPKTDVCSMDRHIFPAAASQPPPVFPSSFRRAPDGKVLLNHVQLLQALCSLHQVKGKNGYLEVQCVFPDGDAGLLFEDTASRLLDSVVRACKDPLPPGPGDLILQACHVAVKAMHVYSSQQQPSGDFLKHMEDALTELTAMLLHCGQPNRFQVAEKLKEYLITLGGSSLSASYLIRHILSQISSLAEQIWQACQATENSASDTFHVYEYENSCYLFSILEQLLQNSEVRGTLQMGPEQKAFKEKLDQHILLLSDEFPLFALYLWKIGGLLSPLEPHLIKKIRASETNVLLLDAGDQLQGTVWFNFFKGADAAHFMNKLCYDAMFLALPKLTTPVLVLRPHLYVIPRLKGSPPSSEIPDGPYPFIVKSEDGRDVPIVQAYAFGKYLGSLNVSFDEAGNVVTSK